MSNLPHALSPREANPLLSCSQTHFVQVLRLQCIFPNHEMTKAHHNQSSIPRHRAPGCTTQRYYVLSEALFGPKRTT
jgi:hypothetical protein